MQNVAKIAVSLPKATLASLERARRRLRTSRSAVVTRAIEEWLGTHEASVADRRYAEAYLKTPERTDELARIAAAATSSWEPWE